MNYKIMRNILKSLANDSYEDFIKALVSFEYSVEDDEVLSNVYQKYIDNDWIGLLNEEFDNMIEDSNVSAEEEYA